MVQTPWSPHREGSLGITFFSSLISLLIMYRVTEPVLNTDFADRFSTNRFLRNSDGQWMSIRISDSSRALLVAMCQSVWSSFQPFSRTLIAARKGWARCLFFQGSWNEGSTRHSLYRPLFVGSWCTCHRSIALSSVRILLRNLSFVRERMDVQFIPS